ncbi:MAG: TRAP transporter large permease, partial [Defluviitaleaceae bacterium]|nr:TRAP transporter large permease [Defluviitaleaceae bacterium]
MSLGLLFLIFAVLLTASVPVAVSLAVSSLMPSYWRFFETGNFAALMADMQMSIRTLFLAVDSFTLLAIPMFILAGAIMSKGGISAKLFDVFSYFLANKRGGMPCAAVLTTFFYATTSGSGPATVAAVGTMVIPILVSLGYDLKFATALIAVAGGLGVILPPSIPYVLFGSATGTSIGDLFLAGIIPGVLIGGLLLVYAYLYCVKHGEDTEKLMAHYNKVREKGFAHLVKDSTPAILAPVIILGSIYGGVASPTEAAVIAVLYSTLVSVFVYRTLRVKDFPSILLQSVNTYSALMFVLAAALAFGRTLTLMRAPQQVAEFMTGTFTSVVVMLIVINIFLLIIGTFMDTTPAILILAPLLLPIAMATGMHPVHFGVMMIINKAISFVTPPVGVNVFVASS